MLSHSDTGTGTPLVLLHAFPFDKSMWEPQKAIPGLRLICPDLPGFGDSPVEDSTVDSMADAVAKTLDELGIERTVLGGCSMGGYVALAFARRHQQRLRGLILIDTRAEADDEAAVAKRNAMIDSADSLTAEAVIEGMIPKALCEPTIQAKPDVVETVRRIGARQSVEGIIAAAKLMRDRPESKSFLGQIHVPTLVIVGEHDTITPLATAQTLSGGITGATLAMLPKAGHLPNLETPDAFNSKIDNWLKRALLR